jgi:hypothetical protein
VPYQLQEEIMTSKEESQYAKNAEEVRFGKPVGPEHDASFHAPDFYDPKTGKRIPTEYDTEAQKADKGIGKQPVSEGLPLGEPVDKKK